MAFAQSINAAMGSRLEFCKQLYKAGLKAIKKAFQN